MNNEEATLVMEVHCLKPISLSEKNCNPENDRLLIEGITFTYGFLLHTIYPS